MHLNDALRRLQFWTAISAFALLLATYRLWTPQTAFPQVPVFEILCHAPAWLDWISLAALVLGLALLAFSHSTISSNGGCVLVLLSLPTLVCLDQHRLQPWAYQLWLFVAIWFLLGLRKQIDAMRWLMVSIYFYSALGKCDYEFLHSVGQQMLGAILKLFGQDVALLPDLLRLGLVSTFPLAELAIAVGLVWPKSRRIAGLFAIGLHLTLILALGPMGLNHRLGVLIWNAQFAMQAMLVFVAMPCSDDENTKDKQIVAPKSRNGLQNSVQAFGVVLIWTAIAMPLTERFGIWDHWPSWALYAPHSSRVRVEVTAASFSRLPTELVALTRKPSPEMDEGFDLVSVPIDAWSLETLDTPIYPQSRFQLGVARQVAAAVNSNDQVRVTILGTANRFTGKRNTETLEGDAALEQSVRNYWLNTHPRGWLVR